MAVQADFTDAVMKGCRLTRANLRQARLTGANLENADLSGCNLTGADLRARSWSAPGWISPTAWRRLSHTLTDKRELDPAETVRIEEMLEPIALGRERRPRGQARRSFRPGSAPATKLAHRTLTALIAPGAQSLWRQSGRRVAAGQQSAGLRSAFGALERRGSSRASIFRAPSSTMPISRYQFRVRC